MLEKMAKKEDVYEGGISIRERKERGLVKG